MRNATRHSSDGRRLVAGGVLLLVLCALAGPGARADDLPAEGIFITVPNPITSNGISQVKEATARFIDRFKGGPPRDLKIVYDFNPDNKPAHTPDFGPCHDLAAFLLTQHNVRTIAFVHADTTRHTVLPVLACRDIVMSSEAHLGAVRTESEQPEPLSGTILEGYREVVKERRCPAIALKMLDKDMEVVRATRVRGAGDWYIDKRRAAEEAKEGVIVLNPDPVIGTGPSTTLYTAETAQKFGLVVSRKENRQEVAEAYGLGRASLREDPLMGHSPVAWRIEVRGAVTAGLSETLKRQVGRAIGLKANLIILQLDCGGGDTLVALELAKWLSKRNDDKGEYPIMTVAYIPRTAPDTAAFLALGCTEIVMHKDATFGDFSDVITEKRNGATVNVDPARYSAIRDDFVKLAQEHDYPALLARGMMERELTIYHVRHVKTREATFVTGEELKADQAGPRQWDNELLVKAGGPDGRALRLSADEATQWGVARHKVDGLNELYAVYGLNPTEVKVASYDWLDELAGFLRGRVVRIFLVMIGIVCLLLELKMPGVGVPGVIAAVCFVLFFWSHWQSAGLDLLGVLLFILGVVLIAVEVFVLPGFGVAGVSGTLLIVFSLALVALEKQPQTSEEWFGLLAMMGQFGLALIGAILLAVLLISYLPHIPYLNRLMLKPQAEAEMAGEDVSEAVRPETAALLGALGVAATPLRPAGKVKFGDEYIDVVAEGSYVEAGTRVQVIEIEGNRIVVKEVL